VPLGPAVPDAVSDVWVHFNEAVAVPGNVPKEVKKIYEAGSEGKCMTCGGVLKEQTIVHVNALGICAIYCSHKCNQDMDVMGWITQQYDDIKEGVEFRGAGNPDRPE
jgi:hypothetical protein